MRTNYYTTFVISLRFSIQTDVIKQRINYIFSPYSHIFIFLPCPKIFLFPFETVFILLFEWNETSFVSYFAALLIYSVLNARHILYNILVALSRPSGNPDRYFKLIFFMCTLKSYLLTLFFTFRIFNIQVSKKLIKIKKLNQEIVLLFLNKLKLSVLYNKNSVKCSL